MNRSYHFISRNATQDINCPLGTNPAHGQQLLEELLLCRTQKAVERNLIVSYVSMNVQRDFRPDCWQLGISRNTDAYVISDTACVDDSLVRMFDQQPSP